MNDCRRISRRLVLTSAALSLGAATAAAVVSRAVAQQKISGQTALHIKNPRLWSPDDPFLYDLDVRLLKHGKVIDGFANSELSANMDKLHTYLGV